uniref:Uncharacterized protein n=1 Tax=Physcomitrium patens TaxID=3218 RepID=A0A2K1KZX3_PHYPA|nr:hypothetical protein PHYPA_002128 [Physcomitrium patens]
MSRNVSRCTGFLHIATQVLGFYSDPRPFSRQCSCANWSENGEA